MRTRGLGDLVAGALELAGMREVGMCGCKTRRAWLNRLDFRLRAFVRRLVYG